MNNLDFFSGGMIGNARRVELARAAYANRHNINLGFTTESHLIKWLLEDASTAYWYNIGDVVEPEPGRFAIVTDYMKSGPKNLEVYIVAHNGGERWNLFVDADKPNEWNPKIPKGLLDLAKNQILAGQVRAGVDLALEPLREKCPFKDEWKTPVPPCMKKEEENCDHGR